MEPSLLGRAPDAAQQLARLSPTAETDRTFAGRRHAAIIRLFIASGGDCRRSRT
jgi:hypothetical protein